MKSPAQGPLHVGRFERRILAAISIAGLVPLVASLVIGIFFVLETRETLQDERFVRVLDECNATFLGRDDEMRLRVLAEATAVARDPRTDTSPEGLAEALLDGPSSGSLSIVETVGPAPAVEPEPGRCADAGEVPTEVLPALRIRCQSWGGRFFELSAAPPTRPSGTIDEVRDLVRLVVESPWGPVAEFVIAGALLSFVIVVAMSVAFLLSRRVTRRITLLADATGRVGGGDLTVEVPIDERDEVGDLTRAFNAMVADLRASRDRVEYLERVGAWQEMARRLAHEIKNPLTPIQLAVQQAHQSYKGDDARFKKTLEDAREIVDEEVQTLRRLVSEFSEFARLPEPELVPLDLAELAGVAVRTLDPVALRPVAIDRPAPVLTSELPPKPVPVRADPEILRRCLDNLVRNAVQAIDDKGGSTVVVAVRIEGTAAILEVRDDGPGVPPDARERIFQPYFTTKELGTGLGLAIVKKAVLEHDGSIECLPAPEGGACLRIRLPLAGAATRTAR